MGVAYIGKVIEVNPIEGADFIEGLTVVVGAAGKWNGTAKKGQIPMGALCEVYLQDALLPKTPEFAFMEKYGNVVKMRRFKGIPSECLIMPLTVSGDIGDDIGELRGVMKYEKPLPANMGGDVLGFFPSFVPKTDEPNFQTVPEMVEYLRGKSFYSTVKADGSSATVYKYEGHFGCCSRNLELKETPGNAIWQIARQYDLENALRDGYALQVEICGPGIQGNPMGLKKVEPRLFNVYHIPSHSYLDGHAVWKLFDWFPKVDVVDFGKTFEFQSDEELRHYAEGFYPNGKNREGVVIRSITEAQVNGQRISFKVINLAYKI